MEFSSNFTTVAKQSEAVASFRGPMSSFIIVKSINHETGISRRWRVFSQGKRSILVKYLFGKMLWDELNSFERNVFWNLPEITTDLTIFLSLKALGLGFDRKLIRKNLERGSFLGFWFVSRQQYLTLKGRVNWFFIEETISLRKVPKFSGYTRHHKDKGSLGSERDFSVSEIFEPLSNVNEESMLHFLTVGEIPLFGGVIFSP